MTDQQDRDVPFVRKLLEQADVLILGRIPSDDAALRRCADGNSES